jgi:phenylpropionate dioxygenase-like ring-hydroxylating dioxygenase large terminal subunit
VEEADNALLTQTGPGTPCGELFRRYWLPVGVSAEIADLPKTVRVLGEDLVLFRDGQGRPGLLHRQCSHRWTSLEYGRIEERGLRCCYHGWLYDIEGRVLEIPGEPQDNVFRERIRHPAYPCRELGGLIFAYLGPPEKMPQLPRYSFLARGDGTREVSYSFSDYNYLQGYENSADPVHLSILHRGQFSDIYSVVVPRVEASLTPYGIDVEGIWPTTARNPAWRHKQCLALPCLSTFIPPWYDSQTGREPGEPGIRAVWRRPVDDTHFARFQADFTPTDRDGRPTRVRDFSGVVGQGPSGDRRGQCKRRVVCRQGRD